MVGKRRIGMLIGSTESPQPRSPSPLRPAPRPQPPLVADGSGGQPPGRNVLRSQASGVVHA
jgi:hypothetical protein